MSARLDEMDCVAVFDDVLVPWEAFFIYRNPALVARILEVDPIHHRVVVAIIDYPEDGIPSPEQVAAARAAAEAKAAEAKASESDSDDDES